MAKKEPRNSQFKVLRIGKDGQVSERILRSKSKKPPRVFSNGVDKSEKAAPSSRKVKNNYRFAILRQHNDWVSSLKERLDRYGPEAYEEIIEAIDALCDSIDNSYTGSSLSVRGKKFAELVRLSASDISMYPENANSALPNLAAVQYIPRKSGAPSEFLQKHWGTYIEAGICFRPDIKRLDPKLEMALANEFRGRTDELRAILPNQTDATDARLEKAFGAPVRPEKRKAAMSALSIAKKVSAAKV